MLVRCHQEDKTFQWLCTSNLLERSIGQTLVGQLGDPGHVGVGAGGADAVDDGAGGVGIADAGGGGGGCGDGQPDWQLSAVMVTLTQPC